MVFDRTADYKAAQEKMESWGFTVRQHGLRLGYSRPWFYSQMKSGHVDSKDKIKKILQLTDDETHEITKEINLLREMDYRYAEIIEYYYISEHDIKTIAATMRKGYDWTYKVFKDCMLWLANRI